MKGYFNSNVVGMGSVELDTEFCGINLHGGLYLVDKTTGQAINTSTIMSCSQVGDDDICFETRSGSKYILRFETLNDLRSNFVKTIRFNKESAPFNSLKYTELGRMMGL